MNREEDVQKKNVFSSLVPNVYFNIFNISYDFVKGYILPVIYFIVLNYISYYNM